ncbi:MULTISPECIES: DUF6445 family protein [unclassified Caulobacter]|uniref:DUF6445 family protein n=1 Tax=unclassified Caulobacter TaxID=2648921 RepID=UPI000700E39D|nr:MULTISPECIES: DUF6445 family protein [unclassified Caulobacter]KQV62634.1 hypothetical protein ASC62_03600 [Caulobacter sp. Root342]KQV71767.1 hypothetical protein ASC70_22875 [Caulobacter sp. Root343]
MSDVVFEARPDPRIEVLTVGTENTPVLVLDGLLTGGQALVDHAAEAVLAPVKAGVNFYPGVRAPAPAPYVQALVRALRPHMARVFGAPDGGRAGVTCALSMAVTPASKATVVQRLPHIDTAEPNQLAILHYLCGPERGGTAFYRHRETGLETIDPDQSKPYFAALRRQIERVPIDPGYITGSSALFDRIGAVEAAFDRIIVYPSRLLHAGILPDTPVSLDPRAGRLTVNSFYRYEPG